MADIQKELNQIKNAAYGQEVRGSIHDSIKKINDEVKDSTEISNNAKQQVDNIQEQVDNLVVSGDSSVEAAQARVDKDNHNYATLKERLDTEQQNVATQLAETDNKFNVVDWELNSKARNIEGITVFTSDDGVDTDYNIYKDIFASEGVPFCLAIISDRVGKNGYVTKEQLLELQNDYGWEVMSHSKTHPVSSQGQTMIPDLPENEARYELEQSRRDLIAMGLDVQSYAHVGGQYRTRDRKLTREYYRAARTSAYGFYGINIPPIQTHELKTIWLDTKAGYLQNFLQTMGRSEAIAETLRLIKQDIDRAKNMNAMIIISTHTTNMRDSDLQDLFKDVIRYAKQETKVMTLKDALNKMGNIVEVGDYASMGGDRLGGSHIAIGANGKVSGSMYIADLNEFDGNTKFSNYPFGATLCDVSGEVAQTTGLPEGEAGQIENRRTQYTSYGYNYQLYRIFRSNRVYKRDIRNEVLGDWYLDTQGIHLDTQSNFRMNAPIKDYFIGATYTRVLSQHTQDLADAPENKPGIRITHKVIDGESYGMNFQEYHLNFESDLRMYKRRAIDADTWGPWVLM